MFLLIVLILLGVAITYGIFFALFKIVWVLFKNKSNKWPLILAGIGTGLTWAVIVGTIYLLVQMMVAPFKPLMTEVALHPAPVYGERVYRDDNFPFTLTVFDGMQFSDWVNINETYLKFGMDTNALKQKDAAQKGQLKLALIVRSPNRGKTSEQRFATLDKIVRDSQDRRQLVLVRQERLTLEDKPAYLVTGAVSTNRGMTDTALLMLYDEPQSYYVLGVNAGAPGDSAKLEQMVTSLHVTP